MGYEYEGIIVNRHLSDFKSKTGKLIDTNESLELREVYAKAKAFDQIKVIHDKHIYGFLNMSETECIEKIGDILEDK